MSQFLGCELEHTGTASGHSKRITSMALSADGHTVATASRDRTIMLWLVDRYGTGWTPLARLRGHRNAVMAVQWSGDGTRLISGGLDQQVICWDVRDPKRARILWRTGALGGTVWGISSGYNAFLRRGVVASTGVSSGAVHLWDAQTGAKELSFHAFSAGVDDVAVHPGGKLLVAVGSDRFRLFCGAVKVFQMDSGREVLKMQQLHGGIARCVVLSDDDGGAHAVSSSDEGKLNLLVHDVATGSLVRALRGHTSHVRQLCIHKHLLSSASHDRTVRIWKWRSGECVQILKAHANIAAFFPAEALCGDGVVMAPDCRWIANTATLCSNAAPFAGDRAAARRSARRAKECAPRAPQGAERARRLGGRSPSLTDSDMSASDADSSDSEGAQSDAVGAARPRAQLPHRKYSCDSAGGATDEEDSWDGAAEEDAVYSGDAVSVLEHRHHCQTLIPVWSKYRAGAF